MFTNSIQIQSRYRGISLSQRNVAGGSNTTNSTVASATSRFNPMLEMFFKEQEQLLKRTSMYKNTQRFPKTLHEHQQSIKEPSVSNEIILNKRNASVSKAPRSPTNQIDLIKRPEETVQDLTIPLNDEDVPDDDDELASAAAKIPLDEILGKRGGSYFKDTFRYNPLNSCNETTSSVS